ncbi:TadE family protein [Desulfococcus multivorans]|uniref:TadE family protein n=1 Tax=Desulfococcus multivorans DSM 2059 TaxID=1121405 RepID=S7USC1_DESML|nr:TadE family protein [Desulfococcus multivorans]AOY58765.1 TadE family protein [Desulfococcus multivorans]EPR35193.1 TadE family protein [Desulfococcus multivorans DSM 2059]SJZ49706.1 TadE-like protein [Desulfococcus multivorans DSM 2059]
MAKINRTHPASAVELFSESDRYRSGIVAVEFVLILPFLMLILFGIIEFGIFFMNKHVITNASREGARAGIVSRIPRVPEDKIKDLVDQWCKSHLVTFGDREDPITVPKAFDNKNTEISINEAKFGDTLMVKVTFNYDFLFLPIDQIPMEAITVMRYE